MKKKNLLILTLILICTILSSFSVYFFGFSPQSMKSISVDGTNVSTLREYKSIKNPFSVKGEFRTENNEIVEVGETDEKTYLMTHLEYPSFLVSLDDFQNYVRKLQEDGFLVITAVNPSLLEGKGCFYELALPLKDEEHTVVVSLDYNYARKVPTISYIKLPGVASENGE